AENQRYGVAPSVAFGLTGPTRLDLSFFHLYQDNQPDYGIPWVPSDNVPLAAFADQPAPVDFDNYYGLIERDYEHVTTDIFSAEIEHEFSPAFSVRNRLTYGMTERDSIITAPRFAATTT